MHTSPILRRAIVASLLVLTGTAAFAEGDIYSRLAQMREKMMKADSSSMITKEQYLDYIGHAWDMKVEEMKSRDGKLSMTQLKDLESALGRMVH
jgi:hypothetical protein